MTATQTPTETPARSPSLAPAGNLPALALRSTGQALDLIEQMGESEVAQARKLAAEFDLENPVGASLYGAQLMQDFNRSLNELMAGIRIEDAGPAGDVAIAITQAMDEMQIKQMQQELRPGTLANFLTRLPVIGKFLSRFYYFAKRKERFVTLTDGIERKSRGFIRTLLEALLRDDRLIKAVEQRYYAIRLYIAGGEFVLQDGQQRFEALRQQAADSRDALLINRVHALHERIMAFDTRLMLMKIAYTKAPVTGQQLRLGQSAKRTEMEAIQNQLDFTMGDLKAAILQVAGLWAMRKSQKHREMIANLNQRVNELSQDLLAETYMAAKAGQGDALREVENLATLMEKVVKLTTDGLEMDRQNIAARKEAEAYLVQAAGQYKQLLEALPSAR
jgi:uncharacterized protein YaaN involved in tellurite resistance